MKHKGRVENGLLILFDKKLFNIYLKTFEGKHVDLIIKLPSKDRSHQQNRYYWGVIVDIVGKELGYSPDETHEAFKIKFLLDRRGKIPTIRSTATLTTKEFEEYLENIKMWASEFLGIVLPDPE